MKVAVLAGGRSSEHEVSLASADSVRRGLVDAGHDVLDVRISKEGLWAHKGNELQLQPATGLLGADVAFPVLHGPYGEDGVVQGTLDVLDVPYVGSNVSASALCMDKLDFKDVMARAGIPQVEYVRVSEAHWKDERDRMVGLVGKLGLPVFVKPARLGSSVGISKVKSAEELMAALNSALEYDSVAIIEAMSQGKEVECSILGTVDPVASEPGEIVIDAEWYDYEAKYTPGGMELKVPADISENAKEAVQRIAKDAFHRAGCSGISRVDFFVEGEQVLINEINTMPGFTETSVYPKLLEASGISFKEVLERLLQDALRRHKFQHRFKH
jgi:D-alanine-D-alanine ligase